MRISNQIAAFAAIMLFASTQVSLPEDAAQVATDAVSPLAAAAENAGQSARGFPIDGPALGPTTSDNSTRSSSSRSKKRLNLNLFRLRP